MRFHSCVWLVAIVCLLHACTALETRPTAQSAFEQGVALFDQGRYEEALPHFQKAVELDPNFARAFLYMGRSYLNLSRWLEAISPLRTALRLSPQDMQHEVVPLLVDALLGAAKLKLKQGDLPSTITLLKEVLTLHPQATQVLQQLVGVILQFGRELVSQGRFGEASAAYREATQLAPQQLEGYLGLARALLRQGEFGGALSAVKDALRLAPTNLEALALLRQLQAR
jgi:tetratricopeptide (TPR) repeat protein